MSEQIEGVPHGWRLVRIGVPRPGVDWVINHEQSPAIGTVVTLCENWPIIEKIEQSKKYRPFANAKEFEPHRDRWVEYTSPNYGDCSIYRVSAYTSERVWLGPDNVGKTYKEAFHCLRFADGSPFGMEVTE